MLGNLENYASPPDLSVFETRKLSDKIRSYITGLPEPFQTTFNHHLENMKKGADLELTQTDIDLIFKDTAFNETNGFLSYFSRYSQMPIDRYGKTPTVTVKKEIAVLNSLSLEIHIINLTHLGTDLIKLNKVFLMNCKIYCHLLDHTKIIHPT